MNFNITELMRYVLLFSLLCLAACGGGGPAGSGSTGGGSNLGSGGAASYAVGGSITGLTSSIVLQDNGGNNLTVSSNGNFSFSSKIATGSTYNVTVLTQPAGQICSVSTGGGTISGHNVTNVTVVCSTSTFSVKGTITGLIGSVVLQDNGGDNLAVSANGSFTFATPLANGSPYSVTVFTQPSGHICSVANNTGTITGVNVTNVTVACASSGYTVGGTVTGLNGSVVLQDNGGDNLVVSTNGPFTFTTAVASGNVYSVTVPTQPAGQSCTVTGGAGSVSGNITNVGVNCIPLQPRFAYVANESDNTVTSYAVNASTGQLRANGYVTTGLSPHNITVDPTGKFAYVVNKSSNSVSAYSITSTGTLAPVSGSPFATGTNPQSITIHPSGTLAYVVNQNSGTVSVFGINGATGALSQVSGSPFTVATGMPVIPTTITIDPTGKFAYVAGANNIWAFTINATTGALSVVAGSPFTAGLSPFFITTDPAGKFVYEADQYSGNVYGYTINATSGALTAVAGGPVFVGLTSYGIAIDPSGKYAYVTSAAIGAEVTAYTISATTGALTAITGGSVSVAGSPCSITIDPTGRYVYASNITYDDVSVFSLNNSTGILTPLGKIGARKYAVSIALANGSTPVSYAPKFAYAANKISNDVSAYTINASTGALTSVGATVPAGTNPQSVAADPSGQFVYVANYGSNDVSSYTINSTTGALTSVGATVPAGTNPQSVTVDPSGRFVYVANYTTNDVSAYSVNSATGVLTQIVCGTVTGGACGAINAANYAAGTGPMSVAIDPMGMYVYVANYGASAAGGGVSVYLMNPASGVLTAVSGSPFYASTVGASAMSVDPTGEYVYVTNANGGVSLLQIMSRSNGNLRMFVPTGTGTAPSSVIVDPTGSFAYVTNSFNGAGGNSISAYAITATTGALTAITGSPYFAGTNPNAITIDPSGQFVYETNGFNGAGGNSITAYTVSATTGTLSTVVGNPFATGTSPVAITTTGIIH